MQKLNFKERRKQRRQNHIAKDLRSPKYQQRVIEPKRSLDEKFRAERYYKDEVDW